MKYADTFWCCNPYKDDPHSIAQLLLLNPLGHEHINFLGRYQFTMPELPPNQLSPLRDPNSQD